jgi:hypothetical protein
MRIWRTTASSESHYRTRTVLKAPLLQLRWGESSRTFTLASLTFCQLSPGSYSLPNAKPDYFSSAYWDKTVSASPASSMRS